MTTLILRVTLNTGRGGTNQLDRALFVGPKGEGKNEYLPSLAAFDYGPRFVLDRFAELVPSAAGAHAPATRRGCCWSCTTWRSTPRRG